MILLLHSEKLQDVQIGFKEIFELICKAAAFIDFFFFWEFTVVLIYLNISYLMLICIICVWLTKVLK